jgi:hypothetical protein
METTTTTANSSVVMNGAGNTVLSGNASMSTLTSKTKINKIFKATNQSSSSSNDGDGMSSRHHQMQQQQHYQMQQQPQQQQGYLNNNYMHRNLNSNANDLAGYSSPSSSHNNHHNQHHHHFNNIAPEEDDARYDDEYDPNLNDYDPGVGLFFISKNSLSSFYLDSNLKTKSGNRIGDSALATFEGVWIIV